jgi:hypothetical protein
MRQADVMLQVGGVQETVTVTAAVLAGNGVGGAAAIVANRVLPLSANQRQLLRHSLAEALR